MYQISFCLSVLWKQMKQYILYRKSPPTFGRWVCSYLCCFWDGPVSTLIRLSSGVPRRADCFPVLFFVQCSQSEGTTLFKIAKPGTFTLNASMHFKPWTNSLLNKIRERVFFLSFFFSLEIHKHHLTGDSSSLTKGAVCFLLWCLGKLQHALAENLLPRGRCLQLLCLIWKETLFLLSPPSVFEEGELEMIALGK